MCLQHKSWKNVKNGEIAIIFIKFNSLPNNNILDWSKLKAFADVKIYVTEKLKFVLGKVENIMGKGEKGWLPAFSSFPTLFS